MSADQLAAQAAYISGRAIQSLVISLETEHCLALSDEAKAAIHRGMRLVLEPVVQSALEQEAAVHA